MKSGEFEIRTADGLRLSGIRRAAARPVRGRFFLVHGLGEHSGRYERVAAYLNGRGYDVQAFDLRGHGRSEGGRGHAPACDFLMDDIAAFLDQADDGEAGMPGFLFGHSLGGSLVANYVLRRRPRLAGVILSAPAFRPAFAPPAWKMSLVRIMYRLWPSLAVANGLDLHALSRDPEVIRKYRDDPLVHDRITSRLAMDAMQCGQWAIDNASGFPLPLLIMHGDADRLTSCEASREFALRAGENCRLKIWDGLYHELHNEPQSDLVLGEMAQWMDDLTAEK